jgi:hypothetical protein
MNALMLSWALASAGAGALLSARFGVRTLGLALVILAILATCVWLAGIVPGIAALSALLLSGIGLQFGFGSGLISRALLAGRNHSRAGGPAS